ncbi:hypothetical protein [uncultured Cohaesibacter sp.]|uniref:hypothetical protein n=1 Tax=uncultured Cohaesibacter sp. TaxID=1002546 RepID=UPI00292D6CB4|nr:hypothetical protein [uncultured Cohaesibacter sp.]
MLRVIAGVNLFAAIVHLVFWGMAFIHFRDGLTLSSPVPAALATTFGIGVADLVWSVPLLVVGSIGVMQRRAAGWLSAQLANGLYFYSMTFILVRDTLTGDFKPGSYLFMPFTLFAFWALWGLWKRRDEFPGLCGASQA